MFKPLRLVCVAFLSSLVLQLNGVFTSFNSNKHLFLLLIRMHEVE